MLFLLFMGFFNLGNTRPILLIGRRDDVSCDDLNDCRTRKDIIISCLSTIVLCTWVTLHPNITISPDTRRMGWIERSVRHPLRRLMKRVPLLLCALIAPEYILAYAIRQYLQAGEIQRKLQHASQTNTENKSAPVREWTRTHGFFIIMGGFHLFTAPDVDAATSIPPPQPGSPIPTHSVSPLPKHSKEDEKAERPLEFEELSSEELAYLVPTEREIKDKGKVDIISKTLTFLQISWFVVQCIARAVNYLPLTELEVVTLAYATMNGFIFIFWWDKPKDVECPIRVYGKTSIATPDLIEARRGGIVRWNSRALTIIQNVSIYLVGQADHLFLLCKETQVPTFWSGNPGERIVLRSMVAAMILGVGFGAIHFIPWNSEFPSDIEPLLWRISSIAITAIPLILVIFCYFGDVWLHWEDYFGTRVMAAWLEKSLGFLGTFEEAGVIIGAFMTLVYILARIFTLVIAFTTLRALPLDALKTVDWASFIPHL